jgi:hypothetical protein
MYLDFALLDFEQNSAIELSQRGKCKACWIFCDIASHPKFNQQNFCQHPAAQINKGLASS